MPPFFLSLSMSYVNYIRSTKRIVSRRRRRRVLYIPFLPSNKTSVFCPMVCSSLSVSPRLSLLVQGSCPPNDSPTEDCDRCEQTPRIWINVRSKVRSGRGGVTHSLSLSVSIPVGCDVLLLLLLVLLLPPYHSIQKHIIFLIRDSEV